MENPQNCIRTSADEEKIKACRDLLATSHVDIKRLSDLLALAGNEVRLKILFLLREEGELCPCDLADILDMSVPAVSQHIRKLKDRNVVGARRSGQTLYYSLQNSHLEWIEPLLSSLTTSKNEESL